MQDGPVAEGDGCFVEPQTSFAVGSIEVAYGAESDLPVSLTAYRKSDAIALGLTRWGDGLSLSERTQAQEILDSTEVDFDSSWTMWRLEFAGGRVDVKAGPEPTELVPVMTLPFEVDGEMGIVIGSWPAGATVSERFATFDDVAICP